MSGPGHQRGVALITVLLVIALATVAAVEMTRQGVLDLRRSGNALALEQAHQLALGGERWSVAVLAREAERATGGQRGDPGGGDLDVGPDEWPRPLPPIPVEGGQVGGEIIDAQSRFNLNSLVGPGGVDAVAVARFQRLLALLGLDRRIAMAAVDWIDRNRQPTHPGGGENNFYMGLAQPYRIADRPMASASELRRVRGVDAAAWRALEPHVTALPQPTAINIDTAGPVLMQAIAPALEAGGAEKLANTSFREMSEFINHPLVANSGATWSGLSVGSEYFRSRIDVELGPVTYTLYSWLQQDDSGLRVLRRARTPN